MKFTQLWRHKHTDVMSLDVVCIGEFLSGVSVCRAWFSDVGIAY
jgi:hypothetical protein